MPRKEKRQTREPVVAKKPEKKTGPFIGFLEKYGFFIAFLVILAVGVYIRLQPIKWGTWLDEFDPYIQYKGALYIVQHGVGAWFSWFDPTRWAPWGTHQASQALLGIPLTGAVLYWIFSWTGATLMQLMFLWPVASGAICITLSYYLGKKVLNPFVGLMAAFAFAFSPAVVERTAGGFVTAETTGLVGYLLALTFFVMATKVMTTKAISYRQILYSLVAGLGAIMMLISWRAGYYIINIIALFTMLLILLGKARKEILIPTVFALTPPLLFIVLMPSYGTSLYTLGYFALPVFVTILSVALLLTKIEATRNVRLGIIALMVIGVAGLFAIDPAAISGKFADVLLPISRGITSTVAENAPAAFAQIYANLQILAVIAPVGVFLALKKFSPFGILFSLLAVTSLYAGGAFVWLLLLAAVPVAIVSGYVVTALIDKVKESQLMSRKMPKFKMWHVAAIGIIVIIGMVPLIQTSAAEENRPVMILTSSISTSVLVPDWMDALQWMANSTNMPADSTVIAWWDYGYWINIVGNQTVVCDNSTTNGTQIALLAEAFLSNETTALQIFKQLNGSYVVVYQVWEAVGSLYVPTWTQPADFEKSTAMMVWANTLGLNVTQSQYIQYYRINTTSGTVDWPLPVGPLASSCVLYQMIFNIVAPQYAQAGITINPLQYLQLVYLSPNGLVMIYKINYPT